MGSRNAGDLPLANTLHIMALPPSRALGDYFPLSPVGWLIRAKPQRSSGAAWHRKVNARFCYSRWIWNSALPLISMPSSGDKLNCWDAGRGFTGSILIKLSSTRAGNKVLET